MPFTFTLVWQPRGAHKLLYQVCGVILTGRLVVRIKTRRSLGCCLYALLQAPCPYCYSWVCWFSIAMVCSIYRVWVAAYFRWKSKQVRVCPLMCIYSSLTSARATYIPRQSAFVSSGNQHALSKKSRGCCSSCIGVTLSWSCLNIHPAYVVCLTSC